VAIAPFVEDARYSNGQAAAIEIMHTPSSFSSSVKTALAGSELLEITSFALDFQTAGDGYIFSMFCNCIQ